MNLEEIKNDIQTKGWIPSYDECTWLIAEVERLNKRLLEICKAAGEAVDSPPSPIDAYKMLQVEVERLEQDVQIARGKEADEIEKNVKDLAGKLYQRRHRKWALKELKYRWRQLADYAEQISEAEHCLEHAETEVERLQSRIPRTDAPWTLKELDDLREDKKKLREVLKYYADSDNYTEDDWGVLAIIGEYGDAGQKARAVLKQVKEK